MWRLYLEKYEDPMVRILLVAAVVSLILAFVKQDFLETVGIIAAVVLATTVGFYFERDAARKFDVLTQLGEEQPVKVIRSLTPDPSLTPNPSPKGEGDSKGEGSEYIVNSECCKIPKTNREFWVAKIRRNKERDKEEQRKLAEMGWHCITVWECELKPSKREDTLESLAFTLNHIWLQDHGAKTIPYPQLEEEDVQMPMAAEE